MKVAAVMAQCHSSPASCRCTWVGADTWFAPTHIGDQEEFLGPRFWLSPMLFVAAMWGVHSQMKELLLSLTLFLFHFFRLHFSVLCLK